MWKVAWGYHGQNVRIDIIVEGVTDGKALAVWFRVRLCQSGILLLSSFENIRKEDGKVSGADACS